MNIQEQRAAIFSINEIRRIALNEAIKHEDAHDLKTALFDDLSIKKHLFDLVKNICDTEVEAVSSHLEDVEGHPRVFKLVFEFTVLGGSISGTKTLAYHFIKDGIPEFIYKMLLDLDHIYLSI